MLRTIHATRYVTPLREGGSLPAIVEAEDCGLYVLKFRGAGQGPLALVAELVAGEVGRALGLRVPELVLMELDSALGRNEPDYEIRELLLASDGLNLAMDYLPGSVMFDPAVRLAPNSIDPHIASAAVWFDAFVTNIDRTARNPNLLWWHKNLYFIDHGASLYFHHSGEDPRTKALNAFAPIRHHVLLPWATEIGEADTLLRPLLTDNVLSEILAQIPDTWLLPDAGGSDPAQKRAAYLAYFQNRLSGPPLFVEEALRARAAIV